MLSQWVLAAIHLFAFALAFWAVLTRGTAFRKLAAGTGEVRRVLLADNLWGAFSFDAAYHRSDACVWWLRERL